MDMLVAVRNLEGQQVGEVELREDIFGVPVSEPLMHQALKRQLANGRQGTADTKTRAEVSGGGKKPWRQKGTGRARQGSTRAPHWRHGGVVFGPHPRSYEQKMPRQMRRQALRSALTVKAQANQIVVLDTLEFELPKTSEMARVLGNLAVQTPVLILLPGRNDTVELSARGLERVKTLHANYLNVSDLLSFDTVVLPLPAIQVIEGYLG
jgi:large subunit ribosomal protein L4